MKISSKKIDTLESDEIITPLRRVENPFAPTKTFDNYTYYSRREKHAAYFLSKRIIQWLNLRYNVLISNPGDKRLIPKIEYLIELFSDDFERTIFTLNTLDINGEMGKLLLQNCYSNHAGHERGSVEKVDISKFGGGYGVSAEWKRLLDLLTICQKQEFIDSKKIRDFLLALHDQITKNDSNNTFETLRIKSALEILDFDSSFDVNGIILERDYWLKVRESLETISEKGLVRSTSALAKDPNSEIDRIITIAQKNQAKVLKKII